MTIKLLILLLFGSLVFANGCGGTSSSTISTDAADTPLTERNFVPTDWTNETHSKNVEPNFDEVFDDGQVKRLDFIVTEERWQSMLNDMTDRYGLFGQKTSEENLGKTEDPIFVPADIYYNGMQWYRAGIRFKGNSSLRGGWRRGILKLSFKLDFDEFEDVYPQIKNQRFYGFNKFSLKNNYKDNSLIREKVAADVFRDAGLPISHTGFYALYINHGDGPKYFGLYTLVEEVDGPVINTHFSNDKGNLYKPELGSSNFVESTFNSENFEKKTNEGDADWSDIISLFNALHDDTRISAPTIWRKNLETVFNVDGFLKYLAVNGIIQNWDSYGRTPHNFYLYNDPGSGKLTWIPWDNNESLKNGRGSGIGSLPLDFISLDSDEWPLIAKIYADDEYKSRYDGFLSEVISGAFKTSRILSKYDTYSALIEPFAKSEVSGFSFLKSSSDFYTEINALKTHASNRADAVTSYLSDQ